MSTYDLDDDLVRMFLTNRQGNAVPDELAAVLQEQMPIPAPELIGAVVRATYGDPGTVFTRWTTEDYAPAWIDSSDREHVTTETLGKITEILSPGVEINAG